MKSSRMKIACLLVSLSRSHPRWGGREKTEFHGRYDNEWKANYGVVLLVWCCA
jgi:hypothetical protein